MYGKSNPPGVSAIPINQNNSTAASTIRTKLYIKNSLFILYNIGTFYINSKKKRG